MIEYNHKFYKCKCQGYMCVLNMNVDTNNFIVDFHYKNPKILDRLKLFVSELEVSKGYEYKTLYIERSCGGESYMSVHNRRLYFCSEPYTINVLLSEEDFENLVDILNKIIGEFEKINVSDKIDIITSV